MKQVQFIPLPLYIVFLRHYNLFIQILFHSLQLQKLYMKLNTLPHSTFIISLLFWSVCSQRKTESCEQKCQEENSQNNINECLSQCQKKQEILIILVIVIVIFALLMCLGCFASGKIKRKFYLMQEKKKRTPCSEGEYRSQFQTQLKNFKQIFTEKKKTQWVFNFEYKLAYREIGCSSLECERVSDFEYKISLVGKDDGGEWKGQGFFVNTKKGITVWFQKIYAKEDKFISDGSIMIVEMIKNKEGSYEGEWYFRGKKESGICILREKTDDQVGSENDSIQQQAQWKEVSDFINLCNSQNRF